MLQTIHDKASGIFVTVVLGALAVVFVFWGTHLDLMTAQTYAAKVNGEKIPIEEVRKIYQRQLNQFEGRTHDELPAALKEQLRTNAIESFIRHQILLQRTAELRYRIGQADVLRELASEPAFQIDGKYSPDLALSRLLAMQETPASYERTIRQTLQVTQLQDGVAVSQFMTPSELARAAALGLEQREVSYAVVPVARYAAAVAPTEAESASYYDAHKNDYQTQESVALEYVELKRDDLAAGQMVTDALLHRYYDDNKDRYGQKERRRARQILIAASQPADDAAASKKAADIHAKLKGGADFAALAKQFSDDTDTRESGGDLGWQERNGNVVAAVDDAIFSMQPAALHAPIKSKYGYHIVQLDAIEAGKQKTFEEARAEIEPEYRKVAADRDFGERQEKLSDIAFSQSTDLAGVAQAMHLEIRRVPEFTRSAGGGPFAANQAIITAAFSDEVLNGSNSEPIPIADGDVVVLRSSGHRSAAPRPLADVRADIVTRLKREGARRKARETGDAVLASLEQGAVWDQALTSAGLTPTPRQSIARTDATLPAEVRDLLFAAPRPQAGRVVYRGVEQASADYALIAFSAIRDGSSSEALEHRTGRTRELMARLGIGDMAAYVAELERTGKIERNPKALE